jgi:acyl-coenzyme A thioesterase PaaI-like protein
MHGGMLFTFADQIIGHTVVTMTRRRYATVSSDVDFLGAASAGALIEGLGRDHQGDRPLAFIRALVTAGESRLLSVNSIYRLFGDIEADDPG